MNFAVTNYDCYLDVADELRNMTEQTILKQKALKKNWNKFFF